MAKITEADRTECIQMQTEYREALDKISILIKNKENDIQKTTEELEIKSKKLELAVLELEFTSNIMSCISISYYRTNQKIEGELNDARIHLTRVFSLLGDVLGMSNDDTLTSNEKIIEYLSTKISDEWKYEFVYSLGYMIDYLRDLYGDNSKWKNLFLEFEYRLAIASKNFINYKTYIRDLNSDVSGYKSRVKLMNLTKIMIIRTIDMYRIKYEVTDKSIDDMRIALLLTNSLRVIYSFLGEIDSANEQKRIFDIWKKRLDFDIEAKKK